MLSNVTLKRSAVCNMKNHYVKEIKNNLHNFDYKKQRMFKVLQGTLHLT